jgi:cytochrome oxidase Cu insertion factor (SCO1/SenC/PrrC family)
MTPPQPNNYAADRGAGVGKGDGMGKSSAVVAAALVVALAGCLPGYMSNKHAGQEGYYAPPITAVDGDGQTMRLKEHKGKVVLLSFWHGT